MTAEFRSEFQRDNLVYDIRNNANKCKASYFDAKKGYLTFSLVDDCRIISRILIGIPRERVCQLHTLEIMQKNAKPAGFFQQKKKLLNFLFF